MWHWKKGTAGTSSGRISPSNNFRSIAGSTWPFHEVRDSRKDFHNKMAVGFSRTRPSTVTSWDDEALCFRSSAIHTFGQGHPTMLCWTLEQRISPQSILHGNRRGRDRCLLLGTGRTEQNLPKGEPKRKRVPRTTIPKTQAPSCNKDLSDDSHATRWHKRCSSHACKDLRGQSNSWTSLLASSSLNGDHLNLCWAWAGANLMWTQMGKMITCRNTHRKYLKAYKGINPVNESQIKHITFNLGWTRKSKEVVE